MSVCQGIFSQLSLAIVQIRVQRITWLKKRPRVRAPFAAFSAKIARAVGRVVPLIIMIGFILVNSIVRIINRCEMCNGRFGVYSWTSVSTECVWIYTWNGQSSRSYLDHECTRHIVSWWYIHVPNMVSQCQTIKKLWAGHESAQTDGQTDGQTEWFLYTPLNFVRGGYN